jgi:hypothetical protein
LANSNRSHRGSSNRSSSRMEIRMVALEASSAFKTRGFPVGAMGESW